MKKNALKKIRIVMCLLLSVLISNSCKKELVTSAIREKLTIDEAKNWYANKTGNSSKTKTNSENSTQPSIVPEWKLATENLVKESKIIIAVPLNKGKKLAFGKYGFRKLVIHKEENGELSGDIMEVVFDEADVKQRKYLELYEMKKFNGKVILYDLNMNFKTGFKYKNGAIDKIISKTNDPKVTDAVNEPDVKNTNSVNVTCYSEYIPPNDGYYVPGCDCEGYWVTYCSYYFDLSPIPFIVEFLGSNEGGGGGGSGNPGTPINTPFGFYGTLPDPCIVGDPSSPVFTICNEGESSLINALNQYNIIWGLDDSYLSYFVAHEEFINVVRDFLNENGGPGSENRELIKGMIDYLRENPTVSINTFKSRFLGTPLLIADPDADSSADPDNQFFYDADNTNYQEYQDNQPWPTVTSLIPLKNFVPMRNNSDGSPVNCFILAKEQLKKSGYKVSGYDLSSPQLFQVYTEAGGVNLPRTKAAISYMISALTNGIPVFIGVDNIKGAPPKNADKSTDHFIVIVGMDTDSRGNKYFQFYDSSTNNIAKATSSKNRLYYNPTTGKISGETQSTYAHGSQNYDFIITQVRKSIKIN